MSTIDETHDPRRESWVASARGHAEFPIQNLPLGVFSRKGTLGRGGVAIGDEIFDLRAGLEAGLFTGDAAIAAEAAAGSTLNPLMALGTGPRLALRRRLSALLSADNPDRAKIEPPTGQKTTRGRPASSTPPPIPHSTCLPQSAASPIFSPASTTPATGGCDV